MARKFEIRNSTVEFRIIQLEGVRIRCAGGVPWRTCLVYAEGYGAVV